MTTEAPRTGERKLELGRSLSSLMGARLAVYWRSLGNDSTALVLRSTRWKRDQNGQSNNGGLQSPVGGGVRSVVGTAKAAAGATCEVERHALTEILGTACRGASPTRFEGNQSFKEVALIARFVCMGDPACQLPEEAVAHFMGLCVNQYPSDAWKSSKVPNKKWKGIVNPRCRAWTGSGGANAPMDGRGRFETIHPFLDGNGRLGRLLITFLLCAQGALREPILYLSLYFKSNRAAYYELLDRVRTRGDWESWLDFFLIGVRDTADQAANAARRIIALFEQDQKKIEGLGRPAASLLRVLQHMQRNPIVAIPTTAKKIGISAPTVTKSMMHMIDLGLLHEVTGRERHRLFVYEQYLAILNEGTEPLT